MQLNCSQLPLELVQRQILLEVERRVDDAFLKNYLAKLLRMFDRVSEWIKEASRYLNIIL